MPAWHGGSVGGMAKVLLFNFREEQRRKKVKAVLFRLGIPSREVAPEEQDRRIGELAGMPEEMLEAASRSEVRTEPLRHHGGLRKGNPEEMEPVPEMNAPSEDSAETNSPSVDSEAQLIEMNPSAEGLTGAAAETNPLEDDFEKTVADRFPQEESGKAQPPFQEEMIVMLGLNARQFHGFLDGIRAAGVRVPLKAMATEHNIMWTARELHRELAAEHAAMNP